MGITYRPEIDGLRAIAVLSVVLYHAGIGGAGFVGVDVFFVISGYLITSLLLKEHRISGQINLLAFYARRVRRIFPAAALVVLVVLGAASVLLPAAQQSHTSMSAGAALIFGVNVFFQVTSGGYFDGRAEEMPLLHLWSLSVEEQFYFLWPALLILILQFRPRWLLPAIAVLGGASFALAEGLMAVNPEAAFYQMPARFWELAAGGMITALPERTWPRWALPAGVLATLAACVIPMGHFPGVGALPAVAGASLLIAAVHGGATNAFLRSRPMVGIGLISYSLYLWHWPLLAFYRATSIGEGNTQTRLLLCTVALVLAVGSYRYIEQPFRRMRWPNGRTVAIGAGASAVLALSACVIGLDAKPSAADAAAMDRPSTECRYMDTDTVFPKCEETKGVRVAVWGDSMAYAWRPLAEKSGPVADYSRDACPPFLDLPVDQPRDRRCRDFNAKVIQHAREFDTVILVARWDTYASLARLSTTLRSLADVRRVIIIGPTPEMRELVPRCMSQQAEAKCAITRAAFDAKAIPIIAELRTMAVQHGNVELIDPTDYFCTADSCPPVKDGVALYWDTHHVSSTAVRNFRSQVL